MIDDLADKEEVDVLFISFYENVDRWHNDEDAGWQPPSLARTRARLTALSTGDWMKDEVDVVIDGKVLDFSRFLSWTRYGTTSEHDRYNPFNMTLLAGSYYQSLLGSHGYSVRVANAVDRRRLEVLRSTCSPRFVLLSTTLLFDAADLDVIPAAVAQIRECWPKAIVVLGGLMLVSLEKLIPPDRFMARLQSYGADAYVVTPRGETALLAILKCETRERLATCSSIPATYIAADGAMRAPPIGIEEPTLPLESTRIRWNAIDRKDQLYHTVHLRTARSCAFACAFCEYPINQGPLTLMPLEAVEAELRELQALGTVRSIIFTDDTFNVPRRRFQALLKVIAKFDFEWYSFFRPQYADAETARLMKEANCRAVFAGLESVDDSVLQSMNKRATATAYLRGIEEIRRHGIDVHANFIVGFPGDTERAARKIISFLNEGLVDFFTVCTWAFIPSTPVGKRTAELGIEGFGMDWRHNTMTSREAQQLARQIATEQSYAVHNAVRGEAWTEFLLFANGFSKADVRQALVAFNALTERDNRGERVLASPEIQALRRMLERHDLPRPSL